MTTGPGKYEPECSRVLKDTRAETVVLIVINGDRGNGFSVASWNPMAAITMPEELRAMADEIARDLKPKEDA